MRTGSEYVLLARIGDEYFALDGFCSHADGFLADGYLLADYCEVECPIHRRFHLRTGAVTNPPAEVPVAAYDVHVENGDILAGPRSDA